MLVKKLTGIHNTQTCKPAYIGFHCIQFFHIPVQAGYYDAHSNENEWKTGL
jgi:hypothetical protein